MAGKASQGMLSVLDFCIEVFKEKIDGKGEDSFFYSAVSEKAVFGVYDGCGGSGARRYERLQSRTGAYMASRVVSGATKDWFDSSTSIANSIPNIETLADKMQEYLAICKREGETASSIKGKMSKAFPTTAAVIVCAPANGKINATCIWAGDSRCYMLDSSGLMQLTDDDINGLDAMENLTADGGLTNVISASSKIRLHSKQIEIKKPCLLFAATDGCFGYLTTPMEFEFLLVDTLLHSKSISEWENNLQSFLQDVAGDDFSLCGCSLGYGTLDNLQNQFKQRRSFLLSEYIEGIDSKSIEEKTLLWKDYSENYSKYLRRNNTSKGKQQTDSEPNAQYEDKTLAQPKESRQEYIDEDVKLQATAIREKVSKDDKTDKLSLKSGKTHSDKGFKKPTDLD